MWYPRTRGSVCLAAVGFGCIVVAACGPAGTGAERATTGQDTQGVVRCNASGHDPRTTLAEGAAYPYSAVGFLNNGCTAFLIDTDHIAAAAHCFVYDNNGAWQPNLKFYPNFHPDRVASDPNHVPRGDIVPNEVVVGTRVDTGWGSLEGSDWGIARVTNWQDTSGVNLTPISLSTWGGLGSLSNAGYSRDDFTAAQDCGCTGYNKNGNLVCLRLEASQPPPTGQGSGCNVRWIAGRVDPSCTTTSSNGLLTFTCATAGGSSGSPIINSIYVFGSGWRYSAVGVTHGGAPGPEANYAECENSGTNVGASAERFLKAPRFASNIAVNRKPGSMYSTAVFAVDSNTDHVVYRSRNGTSYTSPFDNWSDLGTPLSGMALTRVAACQQYSNNEPQVFVVANNTYIYSIKADSNGVWGTWFGVGRPSSGNGTIADLDAAYDANNHCQLLMVENGRNAYVRPLITDPSPGPWATVASGSYKAITGLYYSGYLYASLLDSSNNLWYTHQYFVSGVPYWTAPTQLGGVTGGWRDMDMTWDEYGRGFMVATPINPSNTDPLYFVPMYGSSAWQWHYFNTHLWAPDAPGTAAPTFLTVTASRWTEDQPGTTSPVVFATDDHGDVYFIEYQRASSPNGWVLDWKSFYNDYILY